MFTLRRFAQKVKDRFANAFLHRAHAPVAAVFQFGAAKQPANNAQANGVPSITRLASDVLIAL